MGNRNHIIALAAFIVFIGVALLSSCSRPGQTEAFVKARHVDERGMYTMMVPMHDSLVTYDFSIFTRIDCRRKVFEQLESPIGIGAVWVSPDSTEYREFFYLDKGSYNNWTSFSRDYCLPYRTGVVPSQYGDWTVSFLVLGDAAKYINGMGIISKMNDKE